MTALYQLYDEGSPRAYKFTEDMFTSRHRGIKRAPTELIEISGIIIGSCIEHQGPRFGRGFNGEVAHAHTGSGRLLGWICYQSPTIFYDPQWECVFWHEYAHVVANQGHTAKWRKVLQDLGEPNFPEYLPRTRCRAA